MKTRRKDAARTRRRLLDAACSEFAKKGYDAATIAEISRKAKANIAAVNYHFGSKDALYVASWKHAFAESLDTYPADGGVPSSAPPDERLRGWILSFMRRIADPENHEFEIAHRELAQPTGMLSKVIHESIGIFFDHLWAIVRELLGDGASEVQVHLCAMSVKSQCFGPMLHERRRKKDRHKHPHPMPGMADFRIGIEELADHITTFSLVGIRETRRQIRGSKTRKGRRR